MRRSLLGMIAAGLLAATCAPGPVAPPVDLVVLVVVDTLRADHLGLAGYERETSPRFDSWAERAAVFDRAYSVAPWTLPTFGSLLTGLYPARHGLGVRRAEEGYRIDRRLADGVPMLAERLARAGLRTAAFVNNPWLRREFQLDRGFELYDYRRRGRGDTRGNKVVDRALDWLARHQSERAFLLVHLMDPHLPYNAPGDYRGSFRGEIAPEDRELVRDPAVVRERLPSLSSEQCETITAAYDEEIAFTDAQLDRLLSALSDKGLLDRSLVIVTSDHGEELFDHGGFEHGHSTYDELLRVPLVALAPGVVPGHRSTPVSSVDIPPTILEATGLPLDDVDGRSLWSSLRGDETQERDRALLVSSTLYGPERRAVIAWPYKLSWIPASDERRLVDLDADPEERIDLSGERPEIVERLVATLTRAAPQASSSYGPQPELDDELIDELEALGYVR